MIREETMTDEKIDRLWMKPIPDMMPAIEWRRRFALDIEQAVLQSEQVQSLRQDGFTDGVLLALQMMTADGDAGSHLHVDLIKTAGLECVVRRAAQEGMVEAAGLNAQMPENVREAIDAAMEQQT